jgi:hypothetical protein
VAVNVEIMRAFVRLRRMLAYADLARKLDAPEKRCDAQFKVVFDAIRKLMERPGPETKRRRAPQAPIRRNPGARRREDG